MGEGGGTEEAVAAEASAAAPASEQEEKPAYLRDSREFLVCGMRQRTKPKRKKPCERWLAFEYSDRGEEAEELEEVFSYGQLDALQQGGDAGADALRRLREGRGLGLLPKEWATASAQERREGLAELLELLELRGAARGNAAAALAHLAAGGGSAMGPVEKQRVLSSSCCYVLVEHFPAILDNAAAALESQESGMEERSALLMVALLVLEHSYCDESLVADVEACGARALLRLLTALPRDGAAARAVPTKLLLLLCARLLLRCFGGYRTLDKLKEAEGMTPRRRTPGVVKSRAADVANYELMVVRRFRRCLPAAIGEGRALVAANLHRPYAERARHFPDGPRCHHDSPVPTVARFSVFFRELLPCLPEVLTNILKLLHATVPDYPGGITFANEGLATEGSLREADLLRHKDIVGRAAALALVLLLKHSRILHVALGDHVRHVLEQARAVPLMLAVLNQDMGKLLHRREDVLPRLFTDETAPPPVGSGHCTWRTMQLATNVLRVAVKLTTRRPSQGSLLLQYKAPAILKHHLFPVSHPLIRLYASKLLKCLASSTKPRWRKANRKLLSKVYANVAQDLCDEWLFPTFSVTGSFLSSVLTPPDSANDALAASLEDITPKAEAEEWVRQWLEGENLLHSDLPALPPLFGSWGAAWLRSQLP